MDVIKNPEQLALQFLSGLPPSLETFADVLSLQYQESEKVLTPKLVTTSLLSHIRTKSSRSSGSRSTEDSALKVDKATAVCHACGKKGHFKAECYSIVGKPKDLLRLACQRERGSGREPSEQVKVHCQGRKGGLK